MQTAPWLSTLSWVLVIISGERHVQSRSMSSAIRSG